MEWRRWGFVELQYGRDQQGSPGMKDKGRGTAARTPKSDELHMHVAALGSMLPHTIANQRSVLAVATSSRGISTCTRTYCTRTIMAMRPSKADTRAVREGIPSPDQRETGFSVKSSSPSSSSSQKYSRALGCGSRPAGYTSGGPSGSVGVDGVRTITGNEGFSSTSARDGIAVTGNDFFTCIMRSPTKNLPT